MIKIISELKQSAGFTSKVSVLEINSYTLTETVQLGSNPVTPMPMASGKNVQIQFSLFKSAADKANGAAPYTAIDFPYSFSLTPGVDDVVNEAYLYSAVSQKLTDAGYLNEVL